jgi:hypothetical protein
VAAAGTQKLHQIVDIASAEHFAERRHAVTTMHDLPSNLAGAAAKTHAAEVGRPVATGTGNAVATQASVCLEHRGAPLPSLRIGSKAGLYHNEEQD